MFLGSIDPCRSNRCNPAGGVCQKLTDKDYYCKCSVLYTGQFCQTKVDVCKNNTLQCEQGICEIVAFIEGKAEVRCRCYDGWYHKYGSKICDTQNPCEAFPNGNPCKNNGVCQPRTLSVSCLCQPGYFGPTCENYARP